MGNKTLKWISENSNTFQKQLKIFISIFSWETCSFWQQKTLGDNLWKSNLLVAANIKGATNLLEPVAWCLFECATPGFSTMSLEKTQPHAVVKQISVHSLLPDAQDHPYLSSITTPKAYLILSVPTRIQDFCFLPLWHFEFHIPFLLHLQTLGKPFCRQGEITEQMCTQFPAAEEGRG